MPHSSEYIHYMQRIDTTGNSQVDIEARWPGLLYKEAVGLLNIGSAKNVYIEEYADSDRQRVFIPKDDHYANNKTDVTFKFVVVGDVENRLNIIENFTEYLRIGIHRYWDTARMREFDFVITDEIKVSEERWHGSQPYVELEIKVHNLNGKTRRHH